MAWCSGPGYPPPPRIPVSLLNTHPRAVHIHPTGMLLVVFKGLYRSKITKEGGEVVNKEQK